MTNTGRFGLSRILRSTIIGPGTIPHSMLEVVSYMTVTRLQKSPSTMDQVVPNRRKSPREVVVGNIACIEWWDDREA